jgi:tetratricopeptide (TPR) repeat protein
MRKPLWIAVIAVPVLGAAVAVVALRSQRAWTSDSADAIAEMSLGFQAEMKLYKGEAAAHYEKALELDPAFVTAKLMLVGSMQVKDKQRLKQLVADVRAADLDRMSPGERFLVRYNLAKLDHDPAAAARVIEAHIAAVPSDSYALFCRCTDLWEQPDWEAAERCNRELLRVDPNWVLAYNYLGYIAMAQGRFAEAEKNFLAYKYIAPDQANPRDSLGELYTLLGRYDEAAAELHEALRLRPDFCTSYKHLLLVAHLKGDPAMADAVIARAAAGGQCGAPEVEALECSAALWRHFLAGDWEGAWTAAQGGCLKRLGGEAVLAHRAATQCGRLGEAQALEETAGKGSKTMSATGQYAAAERSPAVAHMEGVRRLAQGDAAGAVALFDAADRDLAFVGDGMGVLKLMNQVALAEALLSAGAQERATAVRAAVAEVNPRIAGLFRTRRPPARDRS